jgi:Rod binding domain-containing protein
MSTVAAFSIAAPLPQPKAAAPQNPAARKAAEEFEAVFVNELLSHMDQGLSTDGPFTGGQAEGIYRGLFDEAVGKEIAKRGGIGIADNVYREILRMQDAKHGSAAP